MSGFVVKSYPSAFFLTWTSSPEPRQETFSPTRVLAEIRDMDNLEIAPTYTFDFKIERPCPANHAE